MKKVFSFILMVTLFVLATQTILADNPPDPGGGPTGDPVGGGSPLGGGLIFMAMAGLLYGIRQAWFMIKPEK